MQLPELHHSHGVDHLLQKICSGIFNANEWSNTSTSHSLSVA